MAHLLAISGLHIALIYGIIYFLLKIFWTCIETYGIGSFAYYSAIDRFISSLALYFPLRMAHPCVEGGYHAQSIGFWKSAGSARFRCSLCV